MKLFSNLPPAQRNIAYVVAVFVVLLIAYQIYRAYRRNMLNKKNEQTPMESKFLTTRKGSKFCEKLCGGKDNKACMDECKTKEGFYGCC